MSDQLYKVMGLELSASYYVLMNQTYYAGKDVNVNYFFLGLGKEVDPKYVLSSLEAETAKIMMDYECDGVIYVLKNYPNFARDGYYFPTLKFGIVKASVLKDYGKFPRDSCGKIFVLLHELFHLIYTLIDVFWGAAFDKKESFGYLDDFRDIWFQRIPKKPGALTKAATKMRMPYFKIPKQPLPEDVDAYYRPGVLRSDEIYGKLLASPYVRER